MRTRTPPFTRELGWATAIAALLSALVWLPMWLSYPHAQVHDGAFFHKMAEVARISVTRYHELPLWNPFECGGVPLWDNPQGIGAAPMTWLNLLVDSSRMIQIWFYVHSTLGVLSMWTFARWDLKLSPAASLIAGASFSFAGINNLHFYGGHLVWAPYLYFPFALDKWASGPILDIGIGTNPGPYSSTASPDYTFSQNSGSFTTRTIAWFVR